MTKKMAPRTLMALIAVLGVAWNVFAQAPQLNAVDKAFVDAAAKRLTELDGVAFDRAYLQHIIQEHEEAIAQFTREAQEGQNPQLKAFASKMLPKLRQHQQTAQQLADGQS